MTKENNLEQGGEKVYTKEEGIDQIRMVMQQVTQMGNNDYEIPTLTRLIEAIETGANTQEVVKKAQGILNTKIMNNYH